MQSIMACARRFSLTTAIAAALTAVSISDHTAAQGVRDEELCPEIVESADGAAREKGALVYGLMLYDRQPHSVRSESVHKLALRDLRAAVADGRLPGASARSRRAVVVHMCLKGRPEDDRVTRRAADYLITRIGVSAIVTQTTGQAIVTQRAIAASGASVLHICQGCSTELRELLKNVGATSLVFQSYPPRASFSALIYRKLPEWEARVRQLGGLGPSDRLRVALVRPRSDRASFAVDVDNALVINGTKASLQRGTHYLVAEYAVTPEGEAPGSAEAGAVVAAFRPHIVLGVDINPDIIAVFDALERQLDAAAPRPLYWGWTSHASLVSFIGADDERRRRVYSYASGTALTEAQRERQREVRADYTREFPGASAFNMFNAYAVPYQIMYAAAAESRRQRLTGEDLARGISRTQTPGANPVYVGRRDLAKGLDAAARGPISLRNLDNGHPLNWSRNFGGAPVAGGARIYCFSRNARTGALVETPAGQTWTRETDSFAGTFVPCQ